jgi:hypothetical protein
MSDSDEYVGFPGEFSTTPPEAKAGADARSPLGLVLRTAARIHRADGGDIVEAIIAAAAECAADQAEADTMANAAVCFLAGYWRTPILFTAPLIRLTEWASACTPEQVEAIIGHAVVEADWLAGFRNRPTEMPSPLEMVEAAKRCRDLPGEIAAVQAGQRALETAPWYPARAGDLVHVHYYGSLADMTPEQGETYVVEHSEDEGGLVLRLLHHTAGFEGAGCFAPGMVDAPLMEAWFEAGPDALTIVRDGRVVHGGTR